MSVFVKLISHNGSNKIDFPVLKFDTVKQANKMIQDTNTKYPDDEYEVSPICTIILEDENGNEIENNYFPYFCDYTIAFSIFKIIDKIESFEKIEKLTFYIVGNTLLWDEYLAKFVRDTDNDEEEYDFQNSPDRHDYEDGQYQETRNYEITEFIINTVVFKSFTVLAEDGEEDYDQIYFRIASDKESVTGFEENTDYDISEFLTLVHGYNSYP